jgi:hypothetical protein
MLLFCCCSLSRHPRAWCAWETARFSSTNIRVCSSFQQGTARERGDRALCTHRDCVCILMYVWA